MFDCQGNNRVPSGTYSQKTKARAKNNCQLDDRRRLAIYQWSEMTNTNKVNSSVLLKVTFPQNGSSYNVRLEAKKGGQDGQEIIQFRSDNR